jgi:hypothetical protein
VVIVVLGLVLGAVLLGVVDVVVLGALLDAPPCLADHSISAKLAPTINTTAMTMNARRLFMLGYHKHL